MRLKDVVFIILTIALVVAVVFFGPFVVMKFWNWFVVPATGFNEIGYWLAFGLNMLVSFVTAGSAANKNTTKVNNAEQLFGFVFAIAILYAIFLGIGAWVHCGI